QFTVTGPDHPVTASLGGEAVLSCHLSPRMSAENMEVRWFRSKYSAVVHLYRDGQDQYEQQMLEYGGRTELLKDDITSGRVFLRIRNVQPSDDGQYTCFFQSSVSYEEALLELQVADMGSAPVISVEGHQDGGIRIVCGSSGWYPQPKAQWRDHQGQLLPSASEEITPEANGLFQTEIVIVLTEESNQKVSCCVRSPRLNQEGESVISIAESFFPRVNPSKVAVWVILALLAVLMALASYCFWRQHRATGETLHLPTPLLHPPSLPDPALPPPSCSCTLPNSLLHPTSLPDPPLQSPSLPPRPRTPTPSLLQHLTSLPNPTIPPPCLILHPPSQTPTPSPLPSSRLSHTEPLIFGPTPEPTGPHKIN
ncbi:hypothetical protein KIL84_004280, partial [Mauremys mutica]